MSEQLITAFDTDIETLKGYGFVDRHFNRISKSAFELKNISENTWEDPRWLSKSLRLFCGFRNGGLCPHNKSTTVEVVWRRITRRRLDENKIRDFTKHMIILKDMYRKNSEQTPEEVDKLQKQHNKRMRIALTAYLQEWSGVDCLKFEYTCDSK